MTAIVFVVLASVAAITAQGASASTGSEASAIKTYFAPGVQLTAAAVMLAESGGDRFAVGPNGEKGLFQLMDGTPGCDWTDVWCNTRTAAAMQRAQGWSPWATFTSGRFQSFLGEAATLLNAGAVSAPADPPASRPARHHRHSGGAGRSGCAALAPGRASFGVLTQGSTGGLVRRVQQRVATTVDGVYGTRTVAAVTRRQARSGVVQDGVVGRQTACVLGV